jgi:hypothetical protein
MSMMDVCGPVFCPVCPPRKNKRGEQIGIRLRCSEDNYSGCGVDMANCPECGKGFQVSFKIDEVTREPTWDRDLDAEKKEEEEYRRMEIEGLRKKADELERKSKK